MRGCTAVRVVRFKKKLTVNVSGKSAVFSGVVWCNVVRCGISVVFDCVVLFVHLA